MRRAAANAPSCSLSFANRVIGNPCPLNPVLCCQSRCTMPRCKAVVAAWVRSSTPILLRNDQLQDFQFASGERRAAHALCELFGHAWRDSCLSRMDGADGFGEFGQIHSLEQISLCAGLQGTVDVLDVVKGGESNDAGGGW